MGSQLDSSASLKGARLGGSRVGPLLRHCGHLLRLSQEGVARKPRHAAPHPIPVSLGGLFQSGLLLMPGLEYMVHYVY